VVIIVSTQPSVRETITKFKAHKIYSKCPMLAGSVWFTREVYVIRDLRFLELYLKAWLNNTLLTN
jgi:hypothetical protein